METLNKRTWAEISLDALKNNYEVLRAQLHKGCMFLATAKADCYGHGAKIVAPYLQELGADYFSVATVDEALQLREYGITKPILVLGYTKPDCVSVLVENDITQTVFSAEYASQLRERLGGKKLKIHIKLDTGMGRLGFDPVTGLDDIAAVCSEACFDVEGIFTHFAQADEACGREYTLEQFNKYMSAVNELGGKYGVSFRIRHCANSAAMVNFPQMQLDMVRAGIALYGAYPDGSEKGTPELKPVMTLKTRLAQVQSAVSDKDISYGRTATVKTGAKIGVMTIGYADGLHRCASNEFSVKLRGREVPGIGRICMDMSMVDISLVPDAQEGDVITVFGGSGSDYISVEKLAKAAKTISYELFCSVSKRVPRVYINNQLTSSDRT